MKDKNTVEDFSLKHKTSYSTVFSIEVTYVLQKNTWKVKLILKRIITKTNYGCNPMNESAEIKEILSKLNFEIKEKINKQNKN